MGCPSELVFGDCAALGSPCRNSGDVCISVLQNLPLETWWGMTVRAGGIFAFVPVFVWSESARVNFLWDFEVAGLVMKYSIDFYNRSCFSRGIERDFQVPTGIW